MGLRLCVLALILQCGGDSLDTYDRVVAEARRCEAGTPCAIAGGVKGCRCPVAVRALDANGWTGTRFTNANAFPHDFVESTLAGLNGLDSGFGDNALFTIYAGHGNRALLQFGFARNSRCLVRLDCDARSGRRPAG